MKETIAKIALNKNLKGNYWVMRIATGWKDYTPGQFVMIEAPSNETFLRRPFCIADLKDGVAEICYKVVGKGTSALTGLGKGDHLNILGPLGRGFSAADNKKIPKTLIAGGYGIAALFGLAKILKGKKTLLYGAKTVADLIYLPEFKKSGVEIVIMTEDGSAGTKGVVTDGMQGYLNGTDSDIYACGPAGMLKAVAEIVKKMRITNCQLSLESYMACGIGVCSGCAVEDSKGNFVRTCSEGPVFELKDLGRL